MTALRAPLLVNAAFSVASGLVLVLASGHVAEALALDPSVLPVPVEAPSVLMAFGLVLLAHAGLISWAVARPTVRWWAGLNLVVIGPYPLLLLGLVAIGAIGGDLGHALAAADAVIIGAIAGWLGWALRRTAPVLGTI